MPRTQFFSSNELFLKLWGNEAGIIDYNRKLWLREIIDLANKKCRPKDPKRLWQKRTTIRRLNDLKKQEKLTQDEDLGYRAIKSEEIEKLWRKNVVQEKMKEMTLPQLDNLFVVQDYLIKLDLEPSYFILLLALIEELSVDTFELLSVERMFASKRSKKHMSWNEFFEELIKAFRSVNYFEKVVTSLLEKERKRKKKIE